MFYKQVQVPLSGGLCRSWAVSCSTRFEKGGGREGGINSPKHGVGRPGCEVQLVCLPAVRPCTNLHGSPRSLGFSATDHDLVQGVAKHEAIFFWLFIEIVLVSCSSP